MDCIICSNSNVKFMGAFAEYRCLSCGAIWKPQAYLSVKKAREKNESIVKSFWARAQPIIPKPGLLDLKRPALAPQLSKPKPIIEEGQQRLNFLTVPPETRPAIPATGVVVGEPSGDGATLLRPDTSLILPSISPPETSPSLPPRMAPERQIHLLELFCGKATISKTFKSAGHFSFSVDIRKRKGICEPDLRKDVLDLQRSDIPEKVDIVWASPPCDIWSYAGGKFHWDEAGQPRTEKAKKHILVLKKTLSLIDEIKPAYFFIENPRGRMRNYPELITWLDSHKAVAKTLTLSSYGFPTTKPTNLFTNVLSYEPRPKAAFGRGAKCAGKMDNLTKCSRQATPPELAKEILEVCEKSITQNKSSIDSQPLPPRIHGPVGQTTLPQVAPDSDWPAPMKNLSSNEQHLPLKQTKL